MSTASQNKWSYMYCVVWVSQNLQGVEVGEKWWELGVKGTANGKVG